MEPEEVSDGPFMEVEDFLTYLSLYKGRTVILRAMYVAGKARGRPLELEALRVAHDTIKSETTDVELYLEVVGRIDGRLGPDYDKDCFWIDTKDRQAIQQKERLEKELLVSKNSMAKDNIRAVNEKLADYYYLRGDTNNALKSYVRMRDYCTDSWSLLSMCLHVIRISLETNNVMHVGNHVNKAEVLPDVSNTPLVTGKLKAANGLALLLQSKFKNAARRFTEVPVELGENYTDVTTSRDVALYGSLCALATLDRSDLRTYVINNIPFREFLALYPEIREAVNDFYMNRYSSCFSRLEALRPHLNCDMYLGPHVDELYDSVRSRALIQYSLPYTSVSLVSMAADFNTDVKGLENELVTLIGKGQIQARIDSVGQIMYARTANQRTVTFQAALQAGDNFLREARTMLIRSSIIQGEMSQRGGGGGPHSGQSRGNQRQGGGGGRRNQNHRPIPARRNYG